jgi:hypothetical protein
MKKLGAALTVLVLAACARPSGAPAGQPPARPAVAIAMARPSIVVRDARSVQDFWSATVLRPRRLAIARGTIRASAVYPYRAPNRGRVRVTDGTRMLLDAVVGDVPVAWQFAELEGHRRVLIFDGFTGGAHCCFDTTIVPLGAGEGRVIRVDWGDLGETLVPSADGTGDVFRTGDDAMAYAFSSFAASTFAVKVLALRDGGMRDVTGAYPLLIERDARAQWSTYLARRRDPGLTVRADLEPPLVAYLADEARLGRAPEAWARVRAANGPARAFYAEALAWLRGHGYAS